VKELRTKLADARRERDVATSKAGVFESQVAILKQTLSSQERESRADLAERDERLASLAAQLDASQGNVATLDADLRSSLRRPARFASMHTGRLLTAATARLLRAGVSRWRAFANPDGPGRWKEARSDCGATVDIECQVGDEIMYVAIIVVGYI
jgi:hypothetical protein